MLLIAREIPSLNHSKPIIGMLLDHTAAFAGELHPIRPDQCLLKNSIWNRATPARKMNAASRLVSRSSASMNFCGGTSTSISSGP